MIKTLEANIPMLHKITKNTRQLLSEHIFIHLKNTNQKKNTKYYFLWWLDSFETKVNTIDKSKKFPNTKNID